MSKCGILISTDYPFLEASPDGIVECLSCGIGIREVKVRDRIALQLQGYSVQAIIINYKEIIFHVLQCPFCHKDDSIERSVSDRRFCLEDSEGKHQLRRDIAYYYQVHNMIIVDNCKQLLTFLCTHIHILVYTGVGKTVL